MSFLNRKKNGAQAKVFILFKAILAVRAFLEAVVLCAFIFFMSRKGWDGETLFLAFISLLWIVQTIVWYKLYAVIYVEGLHERVVSIGKKIISISILIEVIAVLTGSYRPVSSFDWDTFGQQTNSTLLSSYAQYQDIFFGTADLITPIPQGMAAFAFLVLISFIGLKKA